MCNNFSPVKETITNASYGGSFLKQNKVFRREMSVKAFKELALSTTYANPRPDVSLREQERLYWRSITRGNPLYGADSPGSCYEECVDKFNVSLRLLYLLYKHFDFD